MHHPIQDHLEEYLSDPGDSKIPREFHAHLSSCKDCSRKVQALERQTRLLRGLRNPAGAEPAPGFYARVMTGIETRKAGSLWSPFIEPVFGRRLALACGALVLLMGTYLVSTEPGQHFSTPDGVVTTVPAAASANFDGESIQPKQRDAVLASFVSFRE